MVNRIKAVLAVIVFAVLSASGANHTYYPLAGTVEIIDRKEDSVIVLDGGGNMWRFHGCDDWDYGDIVAMIMDGKGTNHVHDDVIIQMRYAGNIYTNYNKFKN